MYIVLHLWMSTDFFVYDKTANCFLIASISRATNLKFDWIADTANHDRKMSNWNTPHISIFGLQIKISIKPWAVPCHEKVWKGVSFFWRKKKISPCRWFRGHLKVAEYKTPRKTKVIIFKEIKGVTQTNGRQKINNNGWRTTARIEYYLAKKKGLNITERHWTLKRYFLRNQPVLDCDFTKKWCCASVLCFQNRFLTPKATHQ